MSRAVQGKPLRVLVVERSPDLQALLASVLGADPGVRVLGAAPAEQALDSLRRLKPDVIAMGVDLPEAAGVTLTRAIMEAHPIPIVIVSMGRGEQDGPAFRLLDAGALAVAHVPASRDHPDHAGAARELLRTLRSMAEVRLVRRWSNRRAPRAAARQPGIQLVAIGASTGGPAVLRTILAGLPRDFPAPLLVVQHISAGFVSRLVDWLAQSSGFRVQLAVHGERPMPGSAYLAPDGCHLQVVRDGCMALAAGARENGHRPSVSVLFRSVAEVFGAHAIGVLLTGMGKDGARELKMLKEVGATSIVQDAKSATVAGMPSAAIALGAATHVLQPAEIPVALARLAQPRKDPVP